MATETSRAYAEVISRHTGFDRAFVGKLWDAWNNGPAQGQWGISDRHNGHKIFRSRYEYVHPLKDGDRLFIFTQDWRLIREGTLRLREGLFTHREGMGYESKFIVPHFIGETDPLDDRLARDWLQGLNAIALTTMSSEERSHWEMVQRADFERWLEYKDRPREVVSRGQAFYRLGFFESAQEGKPVFEPFDDGIARSLDDGTAVHPIQRGDYTFFFDAQGAYLDRLKFMERDRLTYLQGTSDFARIVDILARTTRMVTIRNHFFVN